MILNYSTVSQSNIVLILGGGPSVALNRKWIKNFCSKNKPTILSPHYEHISTDYIYFNSMRHLEQEINRFSCRNVVCPLQLKRKIQSVSRLNKKKYFYVPFKPTNEKYAYVNINSISIDDNGAINHPITNAGFTAILTSVYFKPQKVFLVGFDGPIRDENGHYLYYMRWNEEVREIPKTNDLVNQERFREEKYWKMLLRFVMSHNIEICTVRTDRLRGIDRKKMGITVL